MTPPVIQNCPEDMTVFVSDGSGFVSVSWIEPTAFDAESPPVELFQTHLPGETFVLGTTTVQYLFNDRLGNRAICAFDVTVQPGGMFDVHWCPKKRCIGLCRPK